MDNVKNMLVQITDSGALSASYTLTIAISIIGTLLVGISWLVANNLIGTLKKIDKKLQDHDKKHEDIEEKHHELKTELIIIKQTHSNKVADEVAEKIWNKISVLNKVKNEA